MIKLKKLSIYIFMIVFLLSLSIKDVKAYTYSDSSFYIEFKTYSEYYQREFAGGGTWNAGNNQNARCIVFKNEEMSQKLHDYYTWEQQIYNDWLCVFFIGGGFEERYLGTPSKGCSPVINTEWFKDKMGISSIPNGLDAIGYSLDSDALMDGSWFSGVSSISQVKVKGNIVPINSIQYVTSFNDLKKYLIDRDDSVVIEGDPFNPPVTQDNSLPVPQSLSCDLHNSYNASNPFIEGSWKNPDNASWDAIKDDVKIHIQYKPKFQFYKRFLSVKDGQRTANQYIELGNEKNENKNHWVNAFPNTPQLKANYIKFETLQQDMVDVARMVGAGEEFYPGGATLLNGTKWRIRYEMPDGRVSYWVVYGVNSIGDVKSSDTVSFQDNEDNVVSSDAVNYQNSWQTDPNNYNPDTINNSLLSRLRQALNDIQSLPNDMNTVANEGSSFAKFLQTVWQKFPEIYVIFIGGLIIAIILRILGR